MIGLMERLLRRTCLPQSSGDDSIEHSETNLEARVAELTEAMPNLPELIAGKRVLDFGCGTGAHAVGLGLLGAREVVGVDINPTSLAAASALAAGAGMSDRVRFTTDLRADTAGFDFILSFNSMEHFSNPSEILRLIKGAMHEHTTFIVSFSPPWLSPYGAHMHFFTPVPWVHLIFPERVVMKVRESYRSDGATRYEDVEGGLNKMTLRKFSSLVEDVGFQVKELRLTAVKGLPFVTKVPVVRELLTVRVYASLRI